MLRDNTIRRKVMAVINEKIDTAQKSYEDGCISLEEQLVTDKASLATRKVEEIIGKLT